MPAIERAPSEKQPSFKAPSEKPMSVKGSEHVPSVKGS